MKKISLLFLVLTSVLFYSCDGDVEPIDPALAGQVGSNNNGNGGTSSGDYWPAAIGNWWQFEQNGSTLEPMEMIGTDTFNGALYYKFSSQTNTGTTVTGTSDTWLHKNGGNYISKTGDVNVNAGGITGTITGFEMIILKDNIGVGETWSDEVTQTVNYTGIPSFTQTINYTGTILAKGVTETVDGETYTDIIKSKIVQVASAMGTTSTYTTEYWFAKDIGPVKYTTTGNGVTYESILIGYAVN